MSVTVTMEPGTSPWPVSRREAEAVARQILVALDMGGASLDLHLVDDAHMARTHGEFAGRTGPTNVLSFPDEDPERPAYLGQVVLSVQTLAREAELYGQTPDEHLARLLAHAFLHLAGLDHGPEMDALTQSAVTALQTF